MLNREMLNKPSVFTQRREIRLQQLEREIKMTEQKLASLKAEKRRVQYS